jgi:hypothetical protein
VLRSLLGGAHWETTGAGGIEEGDVKPPLQEEDGGNVGAPTFKVLLEGFSK